MTSMGFVFGLAGLVFGLVATSRLNRLEKKLKELGVLDEKFGFREK